MGGERAVLGARTPRAEECTWNPGASRHPETPGGWAVGQKEQLETKGQVVKEQQGAESRRTGNVHDDPSFQSQPPGPDAWRLRASLFPAPLPSPFCKPSLWSLFRVITSIALVTVKIVLVTNENYIFLFACIMPVSLNRQ